MHFILDRVPTGHGNLEYHLEDLFQTTKTREYFYLFFAQVMELGIFVCIFYSIVSSLFLG